MEYNWSLLRQRFRNSPHTIEKRNSDPYVIFYDIDLETKLSVGPPIDLCSYFDLEKMTPFRALYFSAGFYWFIWREQKREPQPGPDYQLLESNLEE